MRDRKILHRYGSWKVLRQLRATAAAGPIGHYRRQTARHWLRVAAAFLDYLHQRGLDQCRQDELDAWHVRAVRSARSDLRPFLTWAMRTRLMPKLRLPRTRQADPGAARQGRRHRVDPAGPQRRGDGPDRTRPGVADRPLRPTAQPLGRIARLRVQDVITDAAGMRVRLGARPSRCLPRSPGSSPPTVMRGRT